MPSACSSMCSKSRAPEKLENTISDAGRSQTCCWRTSPNTALPLTTDGSHIFQNLILQSSGARSAQITLSSGFSGQHSTLLPGFHSPHNLMSQQTSDLIPRTLKPWWWIISATNLSPYSFPLFPVWEKNFHHEWKLLVGSKFSCRVLFGLFLAFHVTTTLEPSLSYD